jgi:DNA (cytosine-5)-methyltransferase 1
MEIKKLMSDLINVWDKSVPVEKSSYLQDEGIEYFGVNQVSLPKDKLSMIDLFCGAGGFSVGCSWSGFHSVLGVDHFEPAMKTWVYNHPNSIGCLGDIKNLDPYHVKELLKNRGIKKINLLTGGVPCQGFSIANRKHNDHDERNFLFMEYMKYVEVFVPDYIILENVSGMASTAGGKFVNDILAYMSKLGYSASVQIVNSAEFGVPQIRKRLIFVGVKENAGLTIPFSFPKGPFKSSSDYRTVWDAISDLPKLKNNEFAEDYSSSAKTEYQRLMRGEGNIDIPKPVMLFNHKAPKHPEETIQKIENTKPGEPMYPKFKQRIRLKYDQPSPTQLAGGIRPQFQFGHPDQPRGLTIRERARIQSFPDYYVFKGGIVQERVQTGNAVPPLLIHGITKSIALDIKKRDEVNVNV